MLNWFRPTPLLVPKVGERVDLGVLPKLDPDRLGVLMPHLLIWGMDDEALLPVSWATPPDYCDDLAIRKIAGADHGAPEDRRGDGADRRLFMGLKRRAGCAPTMCMKRPRPLQCALEARRVTGKASSRQR